MVSALATVYSLSDEEEGVDSALTQTIAKSWSLATGLSLMIWYVFAPQCLATLAVIKKETQSLKWALVVLFLNLGIAYLASMAVYQFVTYLWSIHF
ncbi:MAG: hypothetical protein ACD_73C00511G0001 [uncultured bacterium]|nr:MAG: hypothetical protein ACD_73C00511G0001 [uncultured bacterium]